MSNDQNTSQASISDEVQRVMSSATYETRLLVAQTLEIEKENQHLSITSKRVIEDLTKIVRKTVKTGGAE